MFTNRDDQGLQFAISLDFCDQKSNQRSSPIMARGFQICNYFPRYFSRFLRFRLFLTVSPREIGGNRGKPRKTVNDRGKRFLQKFPIKSEEKTFPAKTSHQKLVTTKNVLARKCSIDWNTKYTAAWSLESVTRSSAMSPRAYQAGKRVNYFPRFRIDFPRFSYRFQE